MPRAVIFDVDGTLVDSVDLHARAWQEAFRRFGFQFPFDRVRQQIGKGGDQLIPSLLSPADNEKHHDAIDEFRNAHFQKNYLDQVRPFPKVQELFERCRDRGLKVVLASSGKEKEVERYVEVTGIQGLFEERTSSDDADRSKPHPDIFAAALNDLGSPRPEDVVVVGDTPYDAEAAAKIGLRTVGLLCGGFRKAQLRAAGCVAIYRAPADLLARFDQSPLAPGPGGATRRPAHASPSIRIGGFGVPRTLFWLAAAGGVVYLAWRLFRPPAAASQGDEPRYDGGYTDEYVDAASEDSCPASDPPSFTPVTGASRNR